MRVVILGLVVGCLLPVPIAAAAAPPRTVRLASGTNSPSPAAAAGISADGTRSFFTTADPLVVDDVNGSTDLYGSDQNGASSLVSTGIGPGPSTFARSNDDGSTVWYTTANADSAADQDGATDVYEARADGARRLISAGVAGVAAQFAGASADGSHVAFRTSENVTGTDGDGLADVYDRLGDGSVSLVTPATTGAVLDPQIAPDGSVLFFVTAEALVGEDTDGGQLDAYTVPLAGGSYTLVTPGTAGVTTPIFFPPTRSTFFSTGTSFDAADVDTTTDVYERRSDGSLHLVSGGTAEIPAALISVSPDGRAVLFETNESLTAQDGDPGASDIYERTLGGALRLVSGGTSSDPAFMYTQDASRAVTFLTSEALAAEDTDGSLDLYLRRADGRLSLLTTGATNAGGLTAESFFVAPARTTITGPDLPGTGDANAQTDIYEVTDDGVRLVVPPVPGGTGGIGIQSADGSRILVTTGSPIPGTGDTDAAADVYVAEFAAPVLTGPPALAGTGRVGAPHTCTAAAIVGEGTATTVVWLRNGSPIAGQRSATYAPTVADAGRDLACRTTVANAIGTDTATSAARRIAPVALTSRLAGFPIRGSSLACSGFVGAGTVVTYRWRRGSKLVAGQVARTYRLSSADLGRRITCSATGTSGPASTAVTSSLAIPRRCVVPRVRGLSGAHAATRLGNAGCRVRVRNVAGAGVKRGFALSTSPATGVRLANGARVTLRVRK